MSKVLITCPPMLGLIEEFLPSFAKKDVHVDTPDVVQTLSQEELEKLVPNYDGWIAGDDPVNDAVLAAASSGHLNAIVKWGVGVDNVDFSAAKRHGIKVVNTPNMFGREVADVAICYLVGLARQTFWVDRMVREGKWPKPAGRSLHTCTVGLVGFGDIGRNIAKRLISMSVKIILYDPYITQDNISNAELDLKVWPDEISECDFLVFSCALTENNLHMLNADTLAMCKYGVGVINVARGPLIKETDLIAALESGQVGAVALDVMEVEPLPGESKLRDFDTCILGSHNGSNTKEAVVATSHRAIDELFRLMGI